MVYEDAEKKPQSADEQILAEARERYRNWSDKWRPIREARNKDMRYILGDPWEPADRKARQDDGRPCINHDELGQYINGAIGNLRSAKRGIKVEPGGGGANDKTAEFRQSLIRGIEYRSQAQGAYLNAYQAMLEGSYGFIRLGREYVSDEEDGPDDQQIVISNIPNPDSVLYDPDCKKADWSDARGVYVLDPLPIADFQAQYPDAATQDFSDEDRRIAKDWIGEKTVLVAEYWRVEETPVKKKSGRTVRKKSIVQYILNGVEILERNPQPGKLIPIIPFIGIERWHDDGKGPERKINSMVRLALDPQMSLAYLTSQQMEEAGLTPKVPYIGYVGQFETDKEAWDNCTRKPHAYVQVDPIPDSSNGAPLPLPTRVPFTPNTQAYEVGKDSCRRAVQAAMGITPLPTAAQRQNEKSGVALEKIQQQQAIGSLTFVDKFEAALAFAGRIINSWIPVVYDTEREVSIRKPDDTHQVVRINTDQPYPDPKTQEMVHYPIVEGDHDITISAGPSSDSQREAADEFLERLIGNLQGLPIAPPQAAKLLALAIQMRQLGPKGDEMAEIISPSDNQQQQIPPQLQAAMAQMQQHLQALNAYAQQVEKEKEALQQKLDAHVVDNEYKLKIEQMKIEAGITQAEINTKAQSLEERLKFVEDMFAKLTDNQHEQVMQAADQSHQVMQAQQQQEHEQQMAERQAQMAQMQQASQQAHEQGMAEQQQQADEQAAAQQPKAA